jgi:uncharacterized membrane protein
LHFPLVFLSGAIAHNLVGDAEACVFCKTTYNSNSMEHSRAGSALSRSPIKWLVFLAVGLLLFGWLLNTPAGLLGKADAIGYAVCHRIDARSFHLGARQVPLCARCSGMYLGAMLGLIYQAIMGRSRSGMPSARLWVVLGLLVVAFGVDGLNSYLHFFPGAPTLYDPQNWLRLLTGTGMGVVIAAALFPAFNQTAWKNQDRRPALENFRSLTILLAAALILDLVVLTENPLILYPLALISAAGVLILLSMIYTMLWLMILRIENRFQSLLQMVLPLSGGFGLALVQIAALDFVRYLFTGSWEGFHLG